MLNRELWRAATVCFVSAVLASCFCVVTPANGQENAPQTLSIEFKNSSGTNLRVFRVSGDKETPEVTVGAGKSIELTGARGTEFVVRGPAGAELHRFEVQPDTALVEIDREMARGARTATGGNPRQQSAEEQTAIDPATAQGKWVRKPTRTNSVPGKDAATYSKPEYIEVTPVEGGVQVTRDGGEAVTYKSAGTFFQKESGREMLAVRGDTLSITDPTKKLHLEFERVQERRPQDLVGFWLSDAANEVDYFRFRLDEGRLVCTHNDLETPLSVSDLSATGFQLTSGAETIATFEFQGTDAFGPATAPEIVSIYRREKRTAIPVELSNNTSQELDIHVIPVVKRVASADGARVVEGTRLAVGKLAAGESRTENVEPGSVLAFMASDVEVYRERVVSRPGARVWIATAPAKAFKQLDGNWFSMDNDPFVLKAVTGGIEVTFPASPTARPGELQRARPTRPSQTTSPAPVPPANAPRGAPRPGARRPGAATAVPAIAQNRTASLTFASATRDGQPIANRYASPGGSTLTILKATQAKLVDDNWVATILTKNIELAGLRPHPQPVQLRGWWLAGTKLIGIGPTENRDGYLIDGSPVESLMPNVYRRGGQMWVATDNTTIRVLSEDGQPAADSEFKRVDQSKLDRNLVPLGLVDDPTVSPLGDWVAFPVPMSTAPVKRLQPKVWTFAESLAGVFDGTQHLLRVSNSQNIFRDADYWYVFVADDLMFRVDAQQQIVIFRRRGSTRSAWDDNDGQGGFASTMGKQAVDLSGQWKGKLLTDNGLEDAEWDISREEIDGQACYRIASGSISGPALVLSPSGALTSLKWAGYGTSSAFARTFDQFVAADRWTTADPQDTIAAQERLAIEDAFARAVESRLVATPDLIVLNFEKRYPTLFQRVQATTDVATAMRSVEAHRTEPYRVTVRWLQPTADSASPFAGANSWSITLKSVNGGQLGPIALLDRSSVAEEWRKDCTTLVTTAYGPRLGPIASVELKSTGAQRVKFGQAIVQVDSPSRADQIIIDDAGASPWSTKVFPKPAMAIYNSSAVPALLNPRGALFQDLMPNTALVLATANDEPFTEAERILLVMSSYRPSLQELLALGSAGAFTVTDYATEPQALFAPDQSRRIVLYDRSEPPGKYLIAMDRNGLSVDVQPPGAASPRKMRAVERGISKAGLLPARSTAWSTEDGNQWLAIAGQEYYWGEYTVRTDVRDWIWKLQPLTATPEVAGDPPLTLAMIRNEAGENGAPQAYADDQRALLAKVFSRSEVPLVWSDHYTETFDKPRFTAAEIEFAYSRFDQEFARRSGVFVGKPNQPGPSFAACFTRNHYPFTTISYGDQIDSAIENARRGDPDNDDVYLYLKDQLETINTAQLAANAYVERYARENHVLATETTAKVNQAYLLLSMSGASADDAPAPDVDLTAEQAVEGTMIALDVLSIVAAWIPVFGTGIAAIADKSVDAAKTAAETAKSAAEAAKTAADAAKTAADAAKKTADAAKAAAEAAKAAAEIAAATKTIADLTDKSKRIANTLQLVTDSTQSATLIMDTTGGIKGLTDSINETAGESAGDAEESPEFVARWDSFDELNNNAARVCRELIDRFRANDKALCNLSRLAARDLNLTFELAALEASERTAAAAAGSIDEQRRNLDQLSDDAKLAQGLVLNQILRQLAPGRVAAFSRALHGDYKANLGNPEHALREWVNKNDAWKWNTIAMATTYEHHGWDSWESYGHFIMFYAFDVCLTPTSMDTDKTLVPMSDELITLFEEAGITVNDLADMVRERHTWYISPALRLDYHEGYSGWVPYFTPDLRLKSYRSYSTYFANCQGEADADGYYVQYSFQWEDNPEGKIAFSREEMEAW